MGRANIVTLKCSHFWHLSRSFPPSLRQKNESDEHFSDFSLGGWQLFLRLTRETEHRVSSASLGRIFSLYILHKNLSKLVPLFRLLSFKFRGERAPKERTLEWTCGRGWAGKVRFYILNTDYTSSIMARRPVPRRPSGPLKCITFLHRST